jgi:hypothetical protein
LLSVMGPVSTASSLFHVSRSGNLIAGHRRELGTLGSFSGCRHWWR